MSRHWLGTGPQTRVRCPHCGTESCPAHRPAPRRRTTHRQLRTRARGNLPSVGRITWASSWQSLCCRYYGSRYLVDWIFLIEYVKKSVWTLILINAAEITIRKFFSYLYEFTSPAVNVGIHVSDHQNSEPIPGHHAPWHLTSDIWHLILTIAWKLDLDMQMFVQTGSKNVRFSDTCSLPPEVNEKSVHQSLFVVLFTSLYCRCRYWASAAGDGTKMKIAFHPNKNFAHF